MSQGMSAKRIVRMIGTILLFVLIIGYGIWGAKYIIFGIKLDISGITDGQTATSSPVEIEGVSKRAKSIVINGEQTSIDPDGTFHDTRALMPGVNLITITASDKFGKSVTKKYTVYYPPPLEKEAPQEIQKIETEQTEADTNQLPISNNQ